MIQIQKMRNNTEPLLVHMSEKWINLCYQFVQLAGPLATHSCISNSINFSVTHDMHIFRSYSFIPAVLYGTTDIDLFYTTFSGLSLVHGPQG